MQRGEARSRTSSTHAAVGRAGLDHPVLIASDTVIDPISVEIHVDGDHCWCLPGTGHPNVEDLHHPTCRTRIISWSSWDRMWQCHT